MSPAPPTRDQIISAYEMLLGRPPESEGAINYHIANSRSFDEFREKVLTGPEFQSKYSVLVEKTYGDTALRAKLSGFDGSVASGLDFLELFETVMAPRLGKRAATYRAAYRHLLARRSRDVTILETGCLRSAGNWSGDGQSTLQFEHLVRARGGTVLSIDSSPVSVAIARFLCPGVCFVLSDSVRFLQFLSTRASGLIVDLLHLDSMDIDLADSQRSAEHHLRELTAAWPLLRSGSLVLIDDHDCPTGRGRVSKSVLANEWLAAQGATKIAEDYQIVWAVP
jgi:hypothetical protein